MRCSSGGLAHPHDHVGPVARSRARHRCVAAGQLTLIATLPGPGNCAATGIDQLVTLVKTRLKQLQYRRPELLTIRNSLGFECANIVHLSRK